MHAYFRAQPQMSHLRKQPTAATSAGIGSTNRTAATPGAGAALSDRPRTLIIYTNRCDRRQPRIEDGSIVVGTS